MAKSGPGTGPLITNNPLQAAAAAIQAAAGSQGQGGRTGGIVTGPYLPGTSPPATDERPEKPGGSIPDGYEWVWNEETGQWDLEKKKGGPSESDEFLANDIEAILQQYGLPDTLMPWIRDQIAQGFSRTQIINNLRQTPEYMTAFPENAERVRMGLSWKPEAEILAYRDEAKALARRFGRGEVSNNYIGQAITNDISLAELEHRFTIAQNVERYGAGVRMVMQELGFDFTDDDEWEFFDPARPTSQWDDAMIQARLRGQPLAFGFGIRSEEEARALQLMGVDPDEAARRYQAAGTERPRFERLASINSMIADGLPQGFGNLSGTDNQLLIDAIVLQNPGAMTSLQQLVMQEIARNKGGGGVAGGGAGFLPSGQR